MSEASPPLHRSPLHDAHVRLGARLVDFSGWEMPLSYEGTVAEHRAVRTSVGIFDVSHLGKLRVAGAGAGSALQIALTCDVLALPVGRARYGLCLADDGGCIDDVFVYRLGDDEWLVVPNAANVEAVAAAIGAGGCEVVDERSRWAILAVQGPAADPVFLKVLPDSDAESLRLHSVAAIDVLGEPGYAARTGYTGERGFELYAPAAVATEAFEALIEAGAVPCGLGARDTLRLEMGYALYGHELTREIDPLAAGLGWTIAWDAPFRGRDALLAIRGTGPTRKLFGVRITERGVPRAGYPVLVGERVVGHVTSGNFSPTLGTGIALALGPADEVPELGQRVAIAARGRHLAGVIVSPPFIEKKR